jgi:riboflavin kinase/FMN adenylyltransferase
VLLEVHLLDWPAELGPEGGYGRLVCVDLLHRLHEERKYGSLDVLQQAIAQDTDDARAWLASHS